MKKKINKKIIIPLIFLILFGILYFQFSLIVTPDGSAYYWYTNILDGDSPFSTWSITRGFSFPVILYVFKHLFGSNPTGILIGFFLLYIVLLLTSALILKSILNKYNQGRSNVIYWFLYFFYGNSFETRSYLPAALKFTGRIS